MRPSGTGAWSLGQFCRVSALGFRPRTLDEPDLRQDYEQHWDQRLASFVERSPCNCFQHSGPLPIGLYKAGFQRLNCQVRISCRVEECHSLKRELQSALVLQQRSDGKGTDMNLESSCTARDDDGFLHTWFLSNLHVRC